MHRRFKMTIKQNSWEVCRGILMHSQPRFQLFMHKIRRNYDYLMKDRDHRCIMLAIFTSIILTFGPALIIGADPDEALHTEEKTWYKSMEDFWVFRLLMNLLGYATVFVPGGLVIQYLRRNKYNERAVHGCFGQSAKLCVFGEEKSLEEGPTSASPKVERTATQTCMLLIFCVVGLQGSYLTWGVLQERIMKHEYGASEGVPGERFNNSQFLVFMNRILAFFLACTTLYFTRQPRHHAPLFKYSYSSFSNIMSSWCQYEALKYVSFPTQVLAKASKIIPVMLMGKIVSKRTYQYYEYVTALLISAGVAMFLLSDDPSSETRPNKVTTTSGIFLMVGYMAFDSFTSNWQGELFSQYKMSSVQMMAGVNLFSVLFTSVSLIEQGGFIESAAFMFRHPDFAFHCCILSVVSGSGQLFIFYTISQFGPVTFTIIMTVRQGLAILLSCIIYHHLISPVGVCGILITFFAIFLKIYCNRRMKALKAAKAQVNADGQKV